jgi:hypothetical protein
VRPGVGATNRGFFCAFAENLATCSQLVPRDFSTSDQYHMFSNVIFHGIRCFDFPPADCIEAKNTSGHLLSLLLHLERQNLIKLLEEYSSHNVVSLL